MRQSLFVEAHMAEEITRDTFFKVLKEMDTFKGECKLNVWIIQIAKSTFYNYCGEKNLTQRVP